MSIYIPGVALSSRAMKPTGVCFACQEAIEDETLIFWMGDSFIWLHPSCALNLTIALSHDLAELKRVHGYEPTVLTPRRQSPPQVTTPKSKRQKR